VITPSGLKELFKSIDADGSGTITVEEMKRALSTWGHKINDVCGTGGGGGGRLPQEWAQAPRQRPVDTLAEGEGGFRPAPRPAQILIDVKSNYLGRAAAPRRLPHLPHRPSSRRS
jgi:hypothetical protein